MSTALVLERVPTPQFRVGQICGDGLGRRHPALADLQRFELTCPREELQVRVTDSELGRRLAQRDEAAFLQRPPGLFT